MNESYNKTYTKPQQQNQQSYNGSILVFDIETIPDMHGLHKLGHIDKAEPDDVNAFLDKLQAEKGHNFVALPLQKIIGISCILRRNNKNGEPELFVNSLGDLDSDEQTIIQKFYSLIDKYQPQLVSWNGSGFDLPVLHYRSLINNVHAYQYWDMGDRPDYSSKEYKYNNYINRYHLRHIDLMELLAMYQMKNFAKLDEMAKLCGLPGKMGMDGSKVWQAYQDGQLADIRAYCETDVANTYLLYQKFNAMRFANTDLFEQEKQLFIQTVDVTLPHWQIYLQGF
jgi:3'-5' exonuclease